MMAQRHVLVKVGEGKHLSFDDASVMGMTSGALLMALAGTRAFEVTLRDVALSECAVRVCASASKRAPSEQDAAAARELEGAETLDDVSAGLVGNLFVHVQLPAAVAAAAPAASLEDLLVAGGMRRTDVRVDVVRRAYVRYGGAVAGALAGAGRAEAAVDIYAMAASLPSLTTEADFRLAGLHINGLLYEGGALVRCFRGREEFILKPLDAHENGRALALHEALTTARASIAGLTAFELHPRGDKLFMLMPRHGASLEHLAALDAGEALVLWQSVGGALRGLHALGFAHMDVKPANICAAGAQGFVLVDFGSVARFGEVTSTTAPYVAADFPGAMRRSSARADWWQLAMTLAEKACGERCLDVGACVVPTMAMLATRLREHLPAALWQELEPLLEGGAA